MNFKHNCIVFIVHIRENLSNSIEQVPIFEWNLPLPNQDTWYLKFFPIPMTFSGKLQDTQIGCKK